MNVVKYLTDKNIDYFPKGEELNINCPFCDDREYKMYINQSTGRFKCFHENRCGKSGSFITFQQLLGDEPVKLINDSAFHHTKKRYRKPDPLERYTDIQKQFIQFFSDRKISEDTIKKYGVKVQDNKWMVFPIYKNGEVVNRKYRTLDKKFKAEKDAMLCLFGQQNIPDTAKDIIICEGELDCMVWDQLGFSALSVPSGVTNTDWIEIDYDYLERFSNIYISLDMDEAGRKMVDRISTRLGKWRCYDVQLPFKDINDCLIKNVDSDAIMSFIDNARSFDIPCLKKADEYTEDVVELIEKPEMHNGIDTGYSGLNKIIKGWRDGEVTVWTGKNSSGKSTFINLALNKLAFMHGLESCIGSFELPPKRFLHWLAQTDERVWKAAPEKKAEVVRAYLDAIGQKLYIIDIVGEIDPKFLFEVLRYGAKKYGIKHFLVDSLMRVDLPAKDELRHQKKFVSNLKDFAMENSCHVHLVAHPRKTQKDDDFIDQADIGGSGSITDLADNVIVMHRFSEEQKDKMKSNNKHYDNMLIVKKNREHGETGRVYLRFDRNLKKFFEVENYDD